MAVVYRHIRLDNRKPFYIGIGINERRAHSLKGRNKYWQRVVDKCGYEVQILFDDISYDDAKEKEKEFIALYGRYNISKGLLCNLTDGGDGSIGYKPTEEALLKISETSKGRSKNREQIERWKSKMNFEKSEETRLKISKSLSGRKYSKERIEKQVKSRMLNKLNGKHTKKEKRDFTPEHIERLKESHKGIKQSDETKLKRKQTWALKKLQKYSSTI
jgi:hypothetical protein